MTTRDGIDTVILKDNMELRMQDTRELPAWDEVALGFLNSPENPGSQHSVLVIEARAFRDSASLNSFIKKRAVDLQQLIYRYGSLVFRGFDVYMEQDFEAALLSLQPKSPMPGYFLQEEGRDRIPGTRYVFATNTKIKTGGGFELDNFHSENYFSPDVPALQSFWCKIAPPFGGTTALVYSPGVYKGLTDRIREKLEKTAVQVLDRPIAQVAEDHAVRIELLEKLCRDQGLELHEAPDGLRLRLRKSPVFEHPVTGLKSLQVHLSFQSPMLNQALRQHMISAFRGLPWLLHRLYWKVEPLWQPAVKKSIELVYSIEQKLKKAPIPTKQDTRAVEQTSIPNRFGKDLTPEEVALLAQSIWNNTYLHTWRKGDIFVFDNLSTLHGGLPGFGKRELMVMLCDPVSLDLKTMKGVQRPGLSKQDQPSIWELLRKAKDSA